MLKAIALIGLTVPLLSEAPDGKAAGIDVLWETVLKDYLEDDLWLKRDLYDAGHFLMVPLHAAFLLNRKDWQNDIHSHVSRFVGHNGEMDVGRLNRLHYFYFLSRYCVLAQMSETRNRLPEALPSIIRNEIDNQWARTPAWQWGMHPFEGGIRQRLEWKLTNRNVTRSFYRAVIDEELFLFAIASDMSRLDWGRKHALSQGSEDDRGECPDELFKDILHSAARVFTDEVTLHSDGGWLLQPGVWNDYPDHAYSGNQRKLPNLEKLQRKVSVADVSHSHRFPLWLTSLCDSWSPKDQRNKYRLLKSGLGKQFKHKVLVPPTNEFPFWRTNNFMDGWNGVYRWNHFTTGGQNGYGPFELSGTILLGWWSFLPGTVNLYSDLAGSFPLSTDRKNLYQGPGTSRVRHPLLNGSKWLESGLTELICILASRISLLHEKDNAD